MSGELYVYDSTTNEPINGAHIGILISTTKEWIMLGETNINGCLLYPGEKYRGSYLCRARMPMGYKPYEDTVKFNSPTIIFLDREPKLKETA